MEQWNSFWRNISFRKKIILYTAMILYIFILLFGLLIYNQVTQSMNEISEQITMQQLQSLDEELKSTFASFSSISSTLLLDNHFQEKLEDCPGTTPASYEYDDDIAAYLSTLCSSNTLQEEWEIYFVAERPRALHHENILPLNAAEGTGWYEKLTSRSRNIITWYPESESDRTPAHFICAFGIQNQTTGNIPAYFKMTLDLSNITRPICTAAENLEGVFLLCAQDGAVLWCSEDDSSKYSSYILPYGEITPLKRIGLAGDLGERPVIALDGGKYCYTLFYIEDIRTPMSNYIDFSRYFLVILSVIIILSLCTLLFSSKLVDRRIVAFTSDIKALNENDLDYRPDLYGQDEVGELSRAFFGLIQRIKMQIDRERQYKEKLFELEIQALQAQINPHFLFNTLSVINLLAREIEADNISEALEALANFYHFSLNNDKKMTTLRDELAMLDSYLTICSIRYRNRLTVQKDIDPRALDYSIPKLIIQPFCENAVFHGFPASPLSPKVPKLTITIRLESDHLLIIIADNGDGMTESELKRAMETGFAITNVNTRIKMLYGEEYGVFIASAPGEGVTVSIKLGLTPDKGKLSEIGSFI